jgi:UDP:flavonoid glycosyltransferase YjiC (YdhE family)
VVGFVPHELVLDEAALMITHGGHGSVMIALSKGVPLVCVPSLGADQPLIAERIEALGLGKAVPSRPDGPTLVAAVREVLSKPRFKATSEKFKKLIESSGGAAQGAEELEAVIERYREPLFAIRK